MISRYKLLEDVFSKFNLYIKEKDYIINLKFYKKENVEIMNNNY
jgi:hypothetical protein